MIKKISTEPDEPHILERVAWKLNEVINHLNDRDAEHENSLNGSGFVPIKPCPFCGFKFTKGLEDVEVLKIGHFIECPGCGATGAIKGSDYEAVQAWNQRKGE